MSSLDDKKAEGICFFLSRRKSLIEAIIDSYSGDLPAIHALLKAMPDQPGDFDQFLTKPETKTILSVLEFLAAAPTWDRVKLVEGKRPRLPVEHLAHFEQPPTAAVRFATVHQDATHRWYYSLDEISKRNNGVIGDYLLKLVHEGVISRMSSLSETSAESLLDVLTDRLDQPEGLRSFLVTGVDELNELAPIEVLAGNELRVTAAHRRNISVEKLQEHFAFSSIRDPYSGMTNKGFEERIARVLKVARWEWELEIPY